MAEVTEPIFDREKFRELLLYIVERSQDDDALGDMKLNKLLFYADFLAYRRLGHAISGARYQKLEHGPAPRALLPIRREMAQEELLEVSKSDYYGKPQTVTVAISSADTDLFQPDELQLIDEVLELYADRNGSDMSEISHREIGWLAADEGEDIPYEMSLVGREKPPSRMMERARELAKKHSW